MMVYVVLLDGAYGAQIEKIFTIKTKAEAYRAELQKQYPYYCFILKNIWLCKGGIKMKIVYAENLPILPIIGEEIRIGPDMGEVIEVGYCGGTGKNWVKIEVK